MKKSILILTMLALMVSVNLTSCSADNGEGPEGTEQSNGENGEGSHSENGGEGGSEQGESGTRWTINQTADEVINGIHAIISFNESTNSFEGTLENLNSNVAQQTRLETHIFDANDNSTEFGPTPGVDMQPGEMRNITLLITAGTSFVEFTMHPEIGAPGSGG